MDCAVTTTPFPQRGTVFFVWPHYIEALPRMGLVTLRQISRAEIAGERQTSSKNYLLFYKQPDPLTAKKQNLNFVASGVMR
jgi:hypothetical protein